MAVAPAREYVRPVVVVDMQHLQFNQPRTIVIVNAPASLRSATARG
jgi:hypothetical protein